MQSYFGNCWLELAFRPAMSPYNGFKLYYPGWVWGHENNRFLMVVNRVCPRQNTMKNHVHLLVEGIRKVSTVLISLSAVFLNQWDAPHWCDSKVV